MTPGVGNPVPTDGPIRAPSDLAHGVPPGNVAVGGRVVELGERLGIADALAAVPLRLRSQAEPAPGALVVVEGVWSGTELQHGVVVTALLPSSPASSEFRRFATDGVGRHLELRARALASVRALFDAQRFIEVDTPVRVACPGLDAYVDAVPSEGEFLITSPEHHMKRLLVGGMPRIYQFARCSRAGEYGPWHQPEFMMLEWYRAFGTAHALQEDTEAIVRTVATTVGDAEILHSPAGPVSVSGPFARLTIREAFARFADVSDAVELAERDEGAFFQTLVDRVEPGLAGLGTPVFLTEYPRRQAALARACDHDPSVAERFELYVGGVELCNGFGELTDPVEQRRRFESEQARRSREGARFQPIDEPFLAALGEGMPPSAGNALGFDRLLALACGARWLDEVLAFPAGLRTPP